MPYFKLLQKYMDEVRFPYHLWRGKWDSEIIEVDLLLYFAILL